VPIYTYECQSCGSSLDRRQSFSDEPLKTHDECGGNLRRVIYPAGIVFKGSGFYNTDYKNGTNGKASESTDSKADATKSEPATSDSSASASASSDGSKSGGGDGSSAKIESKSESKSAAPAATTP
jgi:putative FmdB family regulatory protein